MAEKQNYKHIACTPDTHKDLQELKEKEGLKSFDILFQKMMEVYKSQKNG